MIKTLEYHQIYDHLVFEELPEDFSERVFDQSKEIQWLKSQGYAPTSVTFHDDLARNVCFVVAKYAIPEEIITWLTLQWPTATAVITDEDIEQML